MLGFATGYEVDQKINNARVEIDKQIRDLALEQRAAVDSAQRDHRAYDKSINDLRLTVSENKVGVEDALQALSGRVSLAEGRLDTSLKIYGAILSILTKIRARFQRNERDIELLGTAMNHALDLYESDTNRIKKLEEIVGTLTGSNQGSGDGGDGDASQPTEAEADTPVGPIPAARIHGGPFTFGSGEVSASGAQIVVNESPAGGIGGSPEYQGIDDPS